MHAIPIWSIMGSYVRNYICVPQTHLIRCNGWNLNNYHNGNYLIYCNGWNLNNYHNDNYLI
jgi:hypothetical protein